MSKPKTDGQAAGRIAGVRDALDPALNEHEYQTLKDVEDYLMEKNE